VERNGVTRVRSKPDEKPLDVTGWPMPPRHKSVQDELAYRMLRSERANKRYAREKAANSPWYRRRLRKAREYARRMKGQA
jgi:hypothetical protein